MNIQTESRSRPMVFLKVNGLEGKAYVDTCAKISIASHELYEMLKARGQVFHKETATITLADGVSRRQNVLSFEALIELCGRSFKTQFLVLLESRDNRTLLGIDFLQKAGIILNIAQFTCKYIESPEKEFELYQERFVTFGKQIITSTCPLPTLQHPTKGSITSAKLGVGH